jgi:hypothetical protein
MQSSPCRIVSGQLPSDTVSDRIGSKAVNSILPVSGAFSRGLAVLRIPLHSSPPPLRCGPSAGFAFPGHRRRAHRPASMLATYPTRRSAIVLCSMQSGGESAVAAARHAAVRRHYERWTRRLRWWQRGSSNNAVIIASLPNRSLRARIDVKQEHRWA